MAAFELIVGLLAKDIVWKIIKNKHNKETLLRLADEEQKHYKIWEKYTKKSLKPNKLKVFKYKMLAKILGFTFAVKLMENGETEAQDVYEKLAEEVIRRG